MDIDKVIKELLKEKKQVEDAIAMLEEMSGARAPKQRGRKSMSPEERLEVSKRMKRYWVQRRSTAAQEQPAPDASGSETGQRSPKAAMFPKRRRTAGSAKPET